MHILHAFNSFNEFCIFKLVLVPNFTLNSFDFWDQTFPKRVFLVQNRKSSHHNLIMYIRLRLGSKFQSKLTILIFGLNFAKIGIPKNCTFACVIIYYIKLMRKVANRHDNILVSVLLLVAETIRNAVNICFEKKLPLT